MNLIKLLLLSSIPIFSSCLAHQTTAEGGVRLKNSKEFKYNKPKFTKLDKSLIDLDAIYLADSTFNTWLEPKWHKSQKYFWRFFEGGQVLEIGYDSIPTPDLANNPNIGTPGYFIIKGTKLKIDMFQDLNGGQTGLTYGRIKENGDLIIYDQRPETYYSIFNLLEKAEGNERFTILKKIKLNGIRRYTPGW